MATSTALTFDDGPSLSGTPALCRLLEEHSVKATFFVWGEQAVEHAAIVRDVIDSGHSVQPHCWTHKSHLDMTPDEIGADVDHVVTFLRSVGASAPHLWRPPWGQMLDGATTAIARERGLELAGWTVDSTDYAGTSASTMYEIVTSGISRDANGDAVVLLHDGCQEPGQLERRTDVDQTVELVRRLLLDGKRSFGLARGVRASLDEQPARLR
jgi:peptidoglycan/xylan/chitin deacetylase (PgdA/CDA1 family)